MEEHALKLGLCVGLGVNVFLCSRCYSTFQSYFPFMEVKAHATFLLEQCAYVHDSPSGRKERFLVRMSVQRCR